MATCYVKAFIREEIGDCEITSYCGLRDNEELAGEVSEEIFNFLKDTLGDGNFECLVEVKIIGTSSFDGEHTEYDVDFDFDLIDFEQYPVEESNFRITTGVIRADDITAFKEEEE